MRRAFQETMSSPEEQLREARKCTERLINVRERSSVELGRRLQKAGFADDIVEREVNGAVSAGLINDERFALLYMQSKKRSCWGRSHIEAKLRFFGIDIKSFEGYPERFFSDEEEIQLAQEYLKRFHTSSKDPRAACFRRLTSRGFSFETAQKATKKLTI